MVDMSIGKAGWAVLAIKKTARWHFGFRCRQSWVVYERKESQSVSSFVFTTKS